MFQNRKHVARSTSNEIIVDARSRVINPGVELIPRRGGWVVLGWGLFSCATRHTPSADRVPPCRRQHAEPHEVRRVAAAERPHQAARPTPNTKIQQIDVVNLVRAITHARNSENVYKTNRRRTATAATPAHGASAAWPPAPPCQRRPRPGLPRYQRSARGSGSLRCRA